jgi:hypothetical protein
VRAHIAFSYSRVAARLLVLIRRCPTRFLCSRFPYPSDFCTSGHIPLTVLSKLIILFRLCLIAFWLVGTTKNCIFKRHILETLQTLQTSNTVEPRCLDHRCDALSRPNIAETITRTFIVVSVILSAQSLTIIMVVITALYTITGTMETWRSDLI